MISRKTLLRIGILFSVIFVAKISVAADVALFYPGEWGARGDIVSYRELADELGLSSIIVDHRFVNDRDRLFDKHGKRKCHVIIFPGGIPSKWFAHILGKGITCKGAHNILDFIKAGGSAIAICFCGNSLFVKKREWICSNRREIWQGLFREDYVHKGKGFFYRFCGEYAFDGILRGPQKEIIIRVPGLPPYPNVRFLPIRMNPHNEIVRTAKLPPVIYQIVVGGGSIIPAKGQPLDVIGWFPNGTAAIGIVPYGRGRIIMSNPHPNIYGKRTWAWRFKGVMGRHAKRWGWTDKMIKKGRELIRKDKDPDGPGPDRLLAKAMLRYAYLKAVEGL